MKSAAARVAACLLSVTTLLGIGVAAAPAASAGTCYGTVSTHGPVDVGVEASDATNGVVVCFDIAGQRRRIEVHEVYEVVQVRNSFACTNSVGGTIGDPAEPPYVGYRVAVERYVDTQTVVLVCVGVGDAAASVVLHTAPDPEVTVTTPPSGTDYACGESGPSEDVVVWWGGSYQVVTAGASPEELGLCLSTRGDLADCWVFEPDHVLLEALGDCPALVALRNEIDGALAEATAAVGTVGTIVGDAVADAEEAAEAALADVHEVVDPVLADVLAEVAEAYGVVEGIVQQLPVEVGNTMGSCSVSVASLGAPAGVEVRRSPTGQVPASVCVVTGSSVVRVTVG